MSDHHIQHIGLAVRHNGVDTIDNQLADNQLYSLKRKREDLDSDSDFEEQPRRKTAKMATKNGLKASGGASAKQPTKKLVIKSFKVKPTLPENFEDETWQKLRQAIHAIYEKQAIASSLEELYKGVENLCDHKMAESLYKKFETEVDERTKILFKHLHDLQLVDTTSFLYSLNNLWKDYCEQMLLIRSIFLYLDRKYALSASLNSSMTGVRSIWDLALHLFRENVVSPPETDKRVLSGLLALIEQDRLGETVDRTLVSSLVRMYSALNLYTDHFEKHFLETTHAFYVAESENKMQDIDVAQYLAHIEKRLEQENTRVVNYLESKTRKPLIQTLEQTMLAAHIEGMINKGFDALIDENKKDDLKKMYSLFGRVNGTQHLKKAWNSYIKRRGTALVTDQQKDKTMIEELLAFKQKVDSILEESFEKHDDFAYTTKEAFEYFINARQNAPAELLAKFVHGKLRSGVSKAVSDEELDVLMDRIMQIFRFINGKDVFEAFYKKDLGKRLLLGKSRSVDAEKAMISKLKSECGAGFTNKMEGMFKDIELSRDMMGTFKEHVKGNPVQLKPIDLNVYILTTGYWPTYTPVAVTLPAELLELQETFTKFYYGKYTSRRLVWQNALGQCVLKAWFPKGRKELSVSLFQSVVLMLFNDNETLSFEQLKAQSGLEDGELKRTLQSLSLGKVRVLAKEPKTKDVENEDTFTYRRDFTAKLVRLKINAVQMKETKEEQTKTQEGVFQDRQYQVDAAIVRIMKARKTLPHNVLMSELYQQLKFPVKPADLKKRIESLIERDYLERTPDDANVYNYLA
jgi:cullin-4